VTESRRARHQTFLQRTTIWIPAGVISLLMLPLAVTNRTFGDDWTLHLWLVRQQEMNIQANGRPGLFLSAKPYGAFYPIFAFVGSGIYSVGGYLALALGGRPILAYKLLYLGALCLAYGGMTWLSWQLGLRGWRSQIAGLVFVTGSYFLTDMFGQGDLGELMALAAIPFVMAAVAAVTTAPRLKPVHLLGVVLGVFVLTGSHNITLLYGTIFLALLAIVLLGAHTPSRLSRLPWLRFPALVAAAAIGVGLNAWYLLPDLRYGTTTFTAAKNQTDTPTTLLTQWRLLLDPFSRASQVHGRDLRFAIPWMFAVWAIVVAVIAWPRIDRVGRRLIGLLLGLAALYLLLIVSKTPWTWFPRALYNIQFTRRLGAYVLLTTAVLVMVVLVRQAHANEATRRTTSAALAAIAVFTVVMATWQAWDTHSTYSVRGRELTAANNFADVVVADSYTVPPSWYTSGLFRRATGAVIDLGTAHTLNVPEAAVRGSTFSGPVAARKGPLPFPTNISAGEPLVRITGITPIGFNLSGFVVAERSAGTSGLGPVNVTISQAPTRLLRTGALVSKLSLAALGALLAWTVLAVLWPLLDARRRPS
jgi:hypothetical protein